MKSLSLVYWKSKEFLLLLLCLQFILYVTVFFDIPIARQVLGFCYLTFIPGFVILKLLKLNDVNNVETILFSGGFSVAFLMFAGLLINELGPLFGVSEPLSLMPLMIVLNLFIFIAGALVYLRRENVNVFRAESLGLSPLVLLLLIFPILSVVGAMWVNAFENNVILLFMLMAISSLFVFAVVSKNLMPPKLYPLTVLMIAIALLYHSSLISNYIVSFGSDVPVEYFVFKTTENEARWSSTPPSFWGLELSRINAMLSVTILPTIYSTLLNMDSTWVFKLLFPLIFAFVPLGLYQVWQSYVGKRYAFISAFFFMAYETFYTEMLGLNRQILAELFLVLLLLVALSNKLRPSIKMLYFIIFSFGLVTSHYGLSEIFLFFISLTFIFLFVVKKPSRKITASMVVFFFVVMFTWYIYTSDSAAFDSIVGYGNYVYSQLDEFFNPASRGQTVLRGLGLESPPTIWNAISRAFAYVTQFLIVVGFIGLITKRVKGRFETHYFMFSFIAMAFLAALILVPELANTMNMTRFYHILLFFLAPLCVVGAEFLVKLVAKRKKELLVSILLLIVLVPYFLFQTSFVFEVTGSKSWSLPLSMHRMEGYRLYRLMGYIPKENVFGSYWLSKYMDTQNTRVYADVDSRKVLIAYGLIYRGSINLLSNITKVKRNGMVYLGRIVVVDGIIVGRSMLWNSSDFYFLFNDMAKIYSNGGSEIYKNVSSG